MNWRRLTVWELADIIFEEFLPEDLLKEYERDILGKKLTVKERFIAHFEMKLMVPKYNRETSEIIVKQIIEEYILRRENFLNYCVKPNGVDHFSFEFFTPLFRLMNDHEKALRGLLD